MTTEYKIITVNCDEWTNIRSQTLVLISRLGVVPTLGGRPLFFLPVFLAIFEVECPHSSSPVVSSSFLLLEYFGEDDSGDATTFFTTGDLTCLTSLTGEVIFDCFSFVILSFSSVLSLFSPSSGSFVSPFDADFPMSFFP